MVVNLENATVQTIEQDTTFTCVKYEPFFDKEGNKSYDVRFRSNNSDLFLEVRVDASEVDELGRIIEDAKYDGTITYAYIDKAFEEVTKDLEGEEVDKRIVSLLSQKCFFSKNIVTSMAIFFVFYGLIPLFLKAEEGVVNESAEKDNL